MKRIIEANKGRNVDEISPQVSNYIDKMLNEEFENVDATLNSDIKITIKIVKVKLK